MTDNSDKDCGGIKEQVRGHWSTPLLIAGSALVGATAVALWNWRTIVSLQTELARHSESEAGNPSALLDEDIF